MPEQSPFKAYDVRGVYPNEVNEALAEKIGRAFPKIMGAEKMVVGYDCRLSSKKLFCALAEGAGSAGVRVYCIGLCSTPEFYFSGKAFGFKCGVMITASHNPKSFNGFKFMGKNGALFTGLKKLEKKVWEGGAYHALPPVVIDISKKASEKYARFLRGEMPEKNFKAVVDAGSGPGGFDITLAGINALKMNFTPDGNFPAHEPNPLMKNNIRALCSAVKKSRARLGIALDGDADRAVFVDEKGRAVKSDLIAMLFIERLLKSGQSAVLDLRISRLAEKFAGPRDVRIIRSRVGRTNISCLMKKHRAEFGAELSGHYYFRSNNYLDSGILASLKLIGIVSKIPLSSAVKKFKKSFLSEEKSYHVKDRKKAVEGFCRIKGKKQFLDGVTISGKGWWVNARQSNTESLVRLRGEAETKALLSSVMKKAESAVRKIKKIY